MVSSRSQSRALLPVGSQSRPRRRSSQLKRQTHATLPSVPHPHFPTMASKDATKQQAQQEPSARTQKHEQPQSLSGGSASQQSGPSLNICEMNADKEHAALDSWAEHNHKSMKQKEQLYEYREEEEAGLRNRTGSSGGGVFVGGHKVDDAGQSREQGDETTAT